MSESLSEQSAAPTARLVCRCCGLPVLRGQAHWAGDREGHPWHYECAERTGLTIPWHSARPKKESFAGPDLTF